MPDSPLFFWLLLAATIVAMVAQRLKIPYAIALVLTGLAIGAPHLLPEAHLEPHLLFSVFLPPLLFEASLNLRLDGLKRHWRSLTLFALGGTLLSTFAVGYLSFWLLGLPPAVGLVFGALISPTDPISVIAVFKRLGVGKRLSLLVEGESLFNDGVAVVLFGVFLQAATGHPVTFLEGIQRFAVMVLGGTAVGAGIGWIASRVTREFDEHLLEIMLTTVVAFGSYLLAEMFHLSGVIAVVVAGLVVGNHGMETGMSATTRLSVSSFWEYAAFAANSMVFLLLGIEVTFVTLWGDLREIGIAILIVLAGRAAGVYLLGPIASRLEGGIPMSWRHVMFWGGLRGALSIALALGLPRDLPGRDAVVAITFGVVVFSLLAQGLSIGKLLIGLKVQTGRSPVEEAYDRIACRRLTARAALDELQRLARSGMVPIGGADAVCEQYRETLEALDESGRDLHLNEGELRARNIRIAQHQALMAEKSALREAERHGLFSAETLHEQLKDLDARLVDLEAEPTVSAAPSSPPP